VNLNDYSEENIMRFGDALSFILLIDKIRNRKGDSILTNLPSHYVEKLNLHIPENLIKLLADVILSLLDKSWFSRLEARRVASIMDRAGRKEYGGMFEAVIESIKEGQQEALEQGREEGEEMATVKIAMNLLAKGSAPEFVSEITGLPLDEIVKLQQQSTTPP